MQQEQAAGESYTLHFFARDCAHKGLALIRAIDIEHYLHEHIPLSAAMGVRVGSATAHSVTLHAPLAPNINHEETVFGGSASAVAILAAWSLVYVMMRSAGLGGRIVIRANHMQYQKPIRGDFSATATSTNEASWQKLFASLGRRRMGRIGISAVLTCEGEQVGMLDGEFVVMPPDERSSIQP